MQEDSDVKMIKIETSHVNGGPCGGALERKKKNSAKLRSMKDGRTVYVKNDLLKPKRVRATYDPTAWYVLQTSRNKEKESEDILTHLQADYPVEVYVAVQRIQVSKRKVKDRIVIRNKIFVRIDPSHRQAILPLCPYLKRYVTDPLRTLTGSDVTEFARVPDCQMKALRAILDEVDAEVEFSPEVLHVDDEVRIESGIFSRSEILKGIKGTVQMVNGKKQATIILDSIGSFKFTVPVSKLAKIK